MRTLKQRKKRRNGQLINRVARKRSPTWKALQERGKTGLRNNRVDAEEYLTKKVKGQNLRPFKKGNPGKPPGTKHRLGVSVKASVRAVLEEVAANEGTTIRKAIIEGLKGGPRNADRYIRMVAEYVDGKPKDTIDLNAKMRDEMSETSKNRINAKVATMVRNILKKKEREAGGGDT